MTRKKKLLIWDMDNTLIHSQIDFRLMHAETVRLLRQFGIEADESKPVAQIINTACLEQGLKAEQEALIWRRIKEIEVAGLAVAVPEAGVTAVLEALQPLAHLAVLTNNDQQAAEDTLARLGLDVYFECLLGRGRGLPLKPEPAAMHAVLARFPQLTAADALAVGDALIDIRAATAAGIAFVAYNSSRTEDWRRFAVQPLAQLRAWDAAALARLTELLA